MKQITNSQSDLEFEKNSEFEKNGVRNPGPPPQSPNRSVPTIPFLTGIGVALAAFCLFSGIPTLSLAGQQDPPAEEAEISGKVVISDQVKEIKPANGEKAQNKKELGKPTDSKTEKAGSDSKKETSFKEAQRWVQQLGSESWEEREVAYSELLKLGEAARAALQGALKSSDPEVVSKSEELLAELDKPSVEELVRESAQADGRFTGRRRIISGPGGIVTLDLNPREEGKRSVRFDPITKDLERIEKEIFKEFFDSPSPLDTIREMEKQLRQDPLERLRGGLVIETFPGVRMSGSVSKGSFSRNEYRNGSLALSIEGKNGRYTVEPMGFVLETLHPALKSHLPLAKDAGFLVRSVRPESPAAQLGIQPWDILLKAGDQSIQKEEKLAEVFRFPRESVALEILRQGQPLQLKPAPVSLQETKK
ncbi:MAG: hypothetical protein CBC13_11290 [Planctomycetia bacterium TMED53]|nr:MAG: hypothetical protein CBC13_11290 [Planctomycetia bacterium TMED53]